MFVQTSKHGSDFIPLAQAKHAATAELGPHRSTLEENETDDGTETKEESTTLADGSTFTSRADDTMDRRRGQVIIDMRNTQLAGSVNGTGPTPSHKTPASVDEKSSPSINELDDAVEESPEVTKGGDHVPALVTRVPGLNTVVSDLSHQRSVGTSTLSSVTFGRKQPDSSLAMLCDKILYSCRISVFPSVKGS